MSEQETESDEAAESRGLPRWKKALLVLSAASVSLGFALERLEVGSPPSADQRTATALDPESAAASAPVAARSAVAPSVPDPLALGEGSPRSSATATTTATTGTPGSVDPMALAQGGELAGTQSFAPQARGTPAVSGSVRELLAPSATGTDSRAIATPTGAPAGVPWSPLFLRGGLSVFVGFCVGHALRAFFKLTAIALGMAFLGAFGLQYFGFLNLDWAAASDLFDTAGARVASELESLSTFLAGSLPSAGLASFGLFAGFKRSA